MPVTVANAWSKPRWPATDGEVKEACVVLYIQWRFGHPGTQTKLEFIMLSELSQTEKDKCGILFPIDNIQNL